jgi:DNA processing protein
VVLGGGILRPHPRSHFQLFREVVAKGGALLSEYPPHFEPRPYTFPERNRLIAALSDFLFLAQAHDKSGSLGTARFALDLGREIYVLRPVPGDPNFSGSQALIDSGARILVDARELDEIENSNLA